MARVFVGVGSNIKRELHVLHALQRLDEAVGVVGVSTFYETQALERPADPPFVNGVVELTDAMPPEALKALLRRIEQGEGRQANPDRYAPRPIDLDLLLHGDAEERREMQDVLSLTLHADLRKAGKSDRLEDAIDYRRVKKQVLAAVEGSHYQLVEALAERVAALCLEHAGIRRVDVVIDKPGSLRFARSAAVEISREPSG